MMGLRELARAQTTDRLLQCPVSTQNHHGYFLMRLLAFVNYIFAFSFDMN